MIRCINCGRADLQSKVIALEGEVRGEKYVVEIRGLVCPKCGYKTVDGPDTPEFARLLSDKYRAVHNLLTSEQIRGLRKSFQETQEQFAKRLGVGIASVKRWEMGKIQDEHSNALILEKTKVLVTELTQYHFTATGTTVVRCVFCQSTDVAGACVWPSGATDQIFRVSAIKPRPTGIAIGTIAPWIYGGGGRHAR